MKIELPIVPNFICPVADNGEQMPPIAIGSLTDEQLNLIADLWREELLFRARRIRKSGKPIRHVEQVFNNL